MVVVHLWPPERYGGDYGTILAILTDAANRPFHAQCSIGSATLPQCSEWGDSSGTPAFKAAP